MNRDTNIDDLIAKALSGEASLLEMSELSAWKNASPENMEHFIASEKLFLKLGEDQNAILFDTDEAWNKVKGKIGSRDQAVVRKFNIPSGSYDFLKIAAVFLIAAGLGFGAYKFLTPAPIIPVLVASHDNIEEFRLPDSTNIVMNRNTTIAYTFTKNKRKVELNGEALFDLSEDKDRPFEVHAAGVLIRDIGTVFNVKAPGGNDSMVVQVISGEVIMSTAKNQSIVLKKGEEVLYLKSRDEFIKMAIADTNATAYRTKIFVFENASLEAVIQKLNEVYGTGIEITSEIRNCHLTATFKNESVDAIIEIIAETLQLTVTRANNNILLNGTGCEQ